jgi:hypothetical protein
VSKEGLVLSAQDKVVMQQTIHSKEGRDARTNLLRDLVSAGNLERADHFVVYFVAEGQAKGIEDAELKNFLESSHALIKWARGKHEVYQSRRRDIAEIEKQLEKAMLDLNSANMAVSHHHERLASLKEGSAREDDLILALCYAQLAHDPQEMARIQMLLEEKKAA